MRFWRRVLAWLEPPRKLRPTRTGVYFLLAVLAVGFAGVNTGNNLLYFVLGMMLGAIVVSGILSERNLRGLEIVRSIPEDVEAGREATLAYVVTAHRTRLPALGIEIRDRGADGRLEAPVRFARIDPGTTRRRAYPRVFARRGITSIPEVEIATTFPFGLFRKSRRLDVASSARVRPRVRDFDAEDAGSARDEGASPKLARGDGLDLFGLREHSDGDDARRIHWKATARSGRTIVKDPARDEPPTVTIVLDLTTGDDVAVEQAVERAAGLASAYVRDGFGVGLLSGSRVVPPAAGIPGREAVLDALVEASRADGVPPPADTGSTVRVRA